MPKPWSHCRDVPLQLTRAPARKAPKESEGHTGHWRLKAMEGPARAPSKLQLQFGDTAGARSYGSWFMKSIYPSYMILVMSAISQLRKNSGAAPCR
jgi:hypothetical protein